ncbi:methylmalonyl Co-A mutase-associated GTPase MeaB [Lipingzhangella sp. LS1_29]|uniref:Methylmalonyl Co-A mutase-associated GTPase MeaB n=1 Tax=Lipingzhangella rawalii TaxID=2055835 RepID=A0ABU2H5A6_9ACTN|nr:methylmalonyl Co-A mutase-associated GTPase MeaB [Lipingzhangella rawalii]MDS1270492.1 methylmalonyl Co-A mutase-associated GTPase MeaB [Lipingzhangella rawalii]
MTEHSTATELVGRLVAGDRRALARAISRVENADPDLPGIMSALASRTGRARVVGLTGAPGVGKSTTTDALTRALRAQGHSVAVLAVDPSSPFSGGALLGDRIRMQEHAGDRQVYIRSMASRGHLGGLSWAAPHALRVLDAAGFDVILVETVGVGQAEVEIARHADTTLVLSAPGMGDGVQAAKAGVLEVADLLVVNKADREGAHATIRELRQMVSQGSREEQDWKPRIVSLVAARGEGVDELVDRITEHERYLRDSGMLHRRRRQRAREEIEAIALAGLRTRLGALWDGAQRQAMLDKLADQVATGGTDPYTAADTLLAELS